MMKNLNLKFYNEFKKNLCVFVDDEPVTLKSGNRKTTIKTEKDSVKIRVMKLSTFHGKNYFWWHIFLYLIGIFGIFTRFVDKTFWNFDYEIVVDLKDENTDVEFMYDFQKDGTRKVIAKTSANYQVEKHICYKDNDAKQKLKKLKLAKIGIFAGCVILTAAILVLVKVF